MTSSRKERTAHTLKIVDAIICGDLCMSSSFTQGVLVTIIGEAVLQDRLIRLLTKSGVSGYTITPAQGAGSHGKRMGDMAGYNTNIEVKTVVALGASDQLLEDLKPFQSTHALIAFRQNVEGLFD
jgi:hypothetical protein